MGSFDKNRTIYGSTMRAALFIQQSTKQLQTGNKESETNIRYQQDK